MRFYRFQRNFVWPIRTRRGEYDASDQTRSNCVPTSDKTTSSDGSREIKVKADTVGYGTRQSVVTELSVIWNYGSFTEAWQLVEILCIDENVLVKKWARAGAAWP